MKVIFRTDASLEIGAGHVVRCLTLADELRQNGATCVFICREHLGHMVTAIAGRGYEVRTLLSSDEAQYKWLGTSWEVDAEQTRQVIAGMKPDWLVVDHYGLDARWESSLASCVQQTMVIDDLANRPHMCRVLLDQNLGRISTDYSEWVDPRCVVLAGPSYALLRPEFAKFRSQSLERRQTGELKNLLISMGGVDAENSTLAVLAALQTCAFAQDVQIQVVIGKNAPWLADVKRYAVDMPWATQVLVDVSNMAELMAFSDLAIGATGGTAWERCCVGLPSVVLVLSENQMNGAAALGRLGAVTVLQQDDSLPEQLNHVVRALSQGENLIAMSRASSRVTDGVGRCRVAKEMWRLRNM